LLFFSAVALVLQFNRFGIGLIYLILIPQIAAIFFYSTKQGLSLDMLLYLKDDPSSGYGERYFYIGIISVGVISLLSLLKKKFLIISIPLCLLLLNSAVSGWTTQVPWPDYAYFNWRKQANCLEGLKNFTRGTCWLTYYGGGWNGWKSVIYADIDTSKLKSLGPTELIEFDLGYDPASKKFIINGWAADPNGPNYPAGVFASVNDFDYRQKSSYNRIDIWEKLGGKDRKDDMHTLGFKIEIPGTILKSKFKTGESVIVKIKIAAFDLTGFYESKSWYKINPNYSIEKITN
jgi:hypothetical protein